MCIRDSHEGYIPWDDDIDLVMLREDYDKFVQIAPAWLKEDLVLQTVYTAVSYTHLDVYKRQLVSISVYLFPMELSLWHWLCMHGEIIRRKRVNMLQIQ